MRILLRSTTIVATLALLTASATTTLGQSPTTVPQGPTEFTARVGFGDCIASSVEVVDGVTRTRDEVCTLAALGASDPRLDGTWTLDVSHDAYPGGLMLWMGAYRVENDGGTWQQLPNLALTFPAGPTSTKTITLVGEGGYAGSTVVAEAVLDGSGWDLHGFILEGAVPPAPGAAAD